MRRNSLLISILILAVFVYFLFEYRVFHHLQQLLRELYIPFLVVSLSLYSLTYVLRALRFTVFFPRIKPLELCAVLTVHTFFNNLLPFRSGEASFPIILKKLFSVDPLISSASLVVVRLFDLLSLSLIFTVSLLSISLKEKKFLGVSLLLSALIVVTFVLGFKLLKKLKKRFSFASTLFFFLSEFKSFKNLLLVFAYSLLNWILKFTAFFFILKAGKLKLSYFQTVFAATFGEITTVLPIHSLGGFGTYEAGLVGGFALLGFKGSYALTVAFYFHLLLFLMSGILAVMGWTYLSHSLKYR